MGKDFKDGCLRVSPANFASRACFPLPSPLDSGFRRNDGGCMNPLRLTALTPPSIPPRRGGGKRVGCAKRGGYGGVARLPHSGVRRLGCSCRRRGRLLRLGMRRLRFALGMFRR